MNSFWDVIQYLLRRLRILLGRSLPSPSPYPELNNIVMPGKFTAQSPVSPHLCDWQFLDTWLDCLPWPCKSRFVVNISSHASDFAWGGVVHMLNKPPFSLRDYWDDFSCRLPIVIKEAHALVLSLQVCKSLITNSRLDVQTDNRAFMQSWLKQCGKNCDLY